VIWKRRRAAAAAIDGTAAREVAPELDPIKLFVRTGVIDGWIDAGGRRISDLMAEERVLRIRDADGWSTVSIADVLVAGPPPHLSTRRIHRVKRRVAFDVPPYEIVGTAHLPPGTQLDPFVLRTARPILPVTNAWVHDTDTGEDHHLETAIVTVSAITRGRELLGPA
jgi:hypothetical protein